MSVVMRGWMRVLRLSVWGLIGLSVGVTFVGVLMRGMCSVVEHEALAFDWSP